MAELARFTCGGGTSYEREVDDIVRNIYNGRVELVFLRVAEDEETGEIAGLCAVQERPLEGYYAWCVAVIAVSEPYRGRQTHDGTVGDFLLVDALTQISELVEPVPLLWAVIAPENSRSHALFERHGFSEVILGHKTGGRYDVRLKYGEDD